MHTIALNTIADGELPTEFRLFKAGANATTKGVFLFDAKAAELVMAEYRQNGVDLPVDLEHLSLSDGGSREDSLDARGWFQLELRGGELWAVNVKWTPDGARRLSEKTQRYISPAFLTDEAGRVVQIINVALCAMPATHSAPALVAASKPYGKGARVVSTKLSPEQVLLFARHCAREGKTLSQRLRELAVDAAMNDRDRLQAVLDALGLDNDASIEEIAAAVEALMADRPPGDPHAPGSANALAELLALAVSYRDKFFWTTSEYDATRAVALKFRDERRARLLKNPPAPPAKLSDRERAACAKRGITPAAFIARKRSVVRRAR